MLNVVLIVHLILALCLIAVVLLQRSEGGALGIGGGGGGLVSQRSATTALAKITWGLAIGFLCTSLALTLLAQRGGTGSVLERFEAQGGGEVPLPDIGMPAPQDGTPQDGTPQDGAPQGGAPQEGETVPPAPAENMPPAPAPSESSQ